MNVSWLTLRDLEYLVALDTEKHFGRAARSCHVSQPALSSQIKKLEEMLGAALFERSSKKVLVTDVGRKVIDQARSVLEEAQKLVNLSASGRESLTGIFRLAAIATLGPYYIPQFLQPLLKAHPKLELVLREGLTDDLIRDLRQGELDAVLASPTFEEDGLTRRDLFFEPFFLTVPKHHPLADLEPLRLSDLNSEEMVFLEDGHCLRDQSLQLCRPSKRRGVRSLHATSLETLRHLVATGIGYTLMPALAVNDDKRLKRLIDYRSFDSRARAGRMISLYTRETSALKNDAETLANFLRQNLPPSVNMAKN